MAENTPSQSKHAAEKLQALIRKALDRVQSNRDQSLTTVLAEVQTAVQQFYQAMGDLVFQPTFLRTNDVVNAQDYNDNLRGIHEDIARLYKEVQALSQSQLQAYNYAQVVTQEVLGRADGLASTVLDLNILSDQTRGDVLVAGDDFRTTEFVDLGATLASTMAEPISVGGMALAKDGVASVIVDGTKVTVTPIQPQSTGNAPTVGNFERFYEGCYYSFMGQARPEGGQFHISLDVTGQDSSVTGQGDTAATFGQDFTVEDTRFLEMGATEEQKMVNRFRMFDGDPSSFWECEYLYQLPNSLSTSTGEQDSYNADTLEVAAKQYDTAGRDLVFDLMIELPQATYVNLVALNPILFGTTAFPAVLDIATADDGDSQFRTVDGWDSTKFDKVITPEANEFLTTSQMGQSLSPSRTQYRGQGVYPFPLRLAKKIKLRLRVENPVPAIYERMNILLENQVTTTSTVTTTTKKGLFR